MEVAEAVLQPVGLGLGAFGASCELSNLALQCCNLGAHVWLQVVGTINACRLERLIVQRSVLRGLRILAFGWGRGWLIWARVLLVLRDNFLHVHNHTEARRQTVGRRHRPCIAGCGDGGSGGGGGDGGSGSGDGGGILLVPEAATSGCRG